MRPQTKGTRGQQEAVEQAQVWSVLTALIANEPLLKIDFKCMKGVYIGLRREVGAIG